MSNDVLLAAAVTVTLLIVVTLCAVTDIRKHRISNSVLLPALLLAFFFYGVLAGLTGLLDSIQGLVLGLALLFPIYIVGGTSAGDVKLLGVVGALLGANGVLIAGIASYAFGGVFGVLFILWRVIEPVVATNIAQTGGSSEPSAHAIFRQMSNDKPWKAVFPFAPAIACGAYYSLWHLGYLTLVLG
ncbi:MAG: prepilin peptidase [Gammaproteobacteria bacterium]|nr:prepilin peptidase [Gammaproteobacteria bacterium]NNC57664.1 hypothetical protein [Woeseiaceae bacterium]NNL49607.1 hypothetical protein [Woeseiaceae bacterium]